MHGRADDIVIDQPQRVSTRRETGRFAPLHCSPMHPGYAHRLKIQSVPATYRGGGHLLASLYSYLSIFVATSRKVKKEIASIDDSLHISFEGLNFIQISGLFEFPNSWHRLSEVNWIHLTPAGLPFGIPGIEDDIEGAIQHAPQPILHSIIPLPRILFHHYYISFRIKHQYL